MLFNYLYILYHLFCTICSVPYFFYHFMARYFLYLSFRGTAYHGWQVQPGRDTIQACMEGALGTLLSSEVSLTGAGRTDAGVHASFFCAHFDCDTDAPEHDQRFIYRLNALLPNDIAAVNLRRVRDDASARFDALSRTYRYTIATVKDPFISDRAWLLFYPLDLEMMNEASQLLTAHTDFASFCRLHGSNRTTICHVSHARWHVEPGRLIFTITANRFLRNMVRALVGTLIPVGRGKISPNEFEALIEGRDRSLAGQSAPPHGLALTAIEYPRELFLL